MGRPQTGSASLGGCGGMWGGFGYIWGYFRVRSRGYLGVLGSGVGLGAVREDISGRFGDIWGFLGSGVGLGSGFGDIWGGFGDIWGFWGVRNRIKA